MNQYEINKDVPMPEARGNPGVRFGSGLATVLRGLALNESVFVALRKHGQVAGQVSSASKATQKRYAVRSVEEQSSWGVRIWRVE